MSVVTVGEEGQTHTEGIVVLEGAIESDDVGVGEGFENLLLPGRLMRLILFQYVRLIYHLQGKFLSSRHLLHQPYLSPQQLND